MADQGGLRGVNEFRRGFRLPISAFTRKFWSEREFMRELHRIGIAYISNIYFF
jgi:hypothetical protein